MHSSTCHALGQDRHALGKTDKHLGLESQALELAEVPHGLPQDVSWSLEFLAQESQETHAHEKKSSPREEIKR